MTKENKDLDWLFELCHEAKKETNSWKRWQKLALGVKVDDTIAEKNALIAERKLVAEVGFEPTTYGLEVCRSILLSYSTIKTHPD